MTALAPDHLRLLELARAALSAANDKNTWQLNIKKAADTHSVFCNDLWDELERQVIAQDGNLRSLEHPDDKQRRIARNMRTEIYAAVQNTLAETFEDLIAGTFNWEGND